MVAANRSGFFILKVNKNVAATTEKGKNMKCENCGNEHDGSYGSGRFCSDHCRRVYSGKKSFEKRDKNWKSPFLNPEFIKNK